MTLEQKMQELEQAEIQRAYELGKAEQQTCEDAVSRQAVLNEFEEDQYCLEFCVEHGIDRLISMEMVRIRLHDIPSVTPQPKIGHCEDCKHFRKLPYHTDLGRCIYNTGFYPKGDWYCADFESQESEDKE